jgi:hypothetical protein
VACVEEGRGIHRILVGRYEGKRPLERPSRRWKDNIKTDLRKKATDGVKWTRLAENREQWRALVSKLKLSLW